MMRKHIPLIAGTLTFILLASLFFLWTSGDFSPVISKHIPGMDGEPSDKATREPAACENVVIGEFFKKFSDKYEQSASLWPRFRGPDFNNMSREEAKLSDLRDSQTCEILWNIKLGEGHAAAAVLNGKVFVLDYLEEEKSDALRCFSLEDGTELWRRWYKVAVKRNHGISRTIPAVTEKYTVTIGPRCQVMCVKTDSGDLLWGKDLVKEFGTTVPGWYTGQCPLILYDQAIIAPAGKDVLVFGADCETGKILWKTPNRRKWQMSHSSLIPMSFGGKKFLIYSSVGGICGISIDGNDRGEILWETEEFNHKVVAPSPLPLDGGRFLVTAGYGAGAALFQLRESGGEFSVEKLKSYPPTGGLCSEQQTPILYDGHIFSILPKDAGTLNGQFACAKEDEPDKILWSSGKTERFGFGPYLIADGKFFILNENGELNAAKASTGEFQKLGTFKALAGSDAWGPIALTDGKMIIRDSTTMTCIRLSNKKDK